jgi:hypothetical protein
MDCFASLAMTGEGALREGIMDNGEGKMIV